MRRVIVRRSSVHGRGVFAIKPLAAGERVLQYKGEITSWRDAVRRHRREGVECHTSLFGLSDGRVIDGSRGGNSARWLNHACAPNCETIEDARRIFIHALRPIVNKVADEVLGSIAIPKRGNDGFVRTGVDVVFHLEMLKLPLPKGDASNGSWRKHEEKDVAGA